MDAVISHATSLFNLFIVRYINTGDRILDTSLIGLITAICIAFVAIIKVKWNYEKIYNKLSYYLHRQKNYFDFKTEWYYHEDFMIISSYNNYNITGENNPVNKFLLENKLLGNKSEIYNRQEKSKSINISRESNNLEPIFFDGNDFIYYCNDDVVFEIGKLFFKEISTWNKFRTLIPKNDDVDNTEVENSLYEFIPAQKEYEISIYREYESSLYREIGKISKTKTFDKLFYDQKDKLLLTLKRFKEGRMYPPSICVDNKIGILLYGVPGCAKTSTILAIANYLKRDILMVDFMKITKRKHFDEIMKYNNIKKYIYVFDEFDCILDVLSSRKVDDRRLNSIINKSPYNTNIKFKVKIYDKIQNKELKNKYYFWSQPTIHFNLYDKHYINEDFMINYLKSRNYTYRNFINIYKNSQFRKEYRPYFMKYNNTYTITGLGLNSFIVENNIMQTHFDYRYTFYIFFPWGKEDIDKVFLQYSIAEDEFDRQKLYLKELEEIASSS